MLEEIRKIDYDRFILSMFIDKAYRGQVAVLIKLNIELSRIKNKVSEPTIGLIRLQWWRDFLKDIYANPYKLKTNHELAPYLSGIIKENKSITYDDFDKLITSRELDFESAPFNSIKNLEDYLKNTAGSLNLIIFKLLGVNINEESKENIIDKISIAWGISAILRSANYNYSKGRAVFPKDLSDKYNLNIDNFGSYDFVKHSRAVVEELVNIADKRLIEAIKLIDKLDKKRKKELKILLIQLSLADRHSKKIRANNYNIFTQFYRVELGFFELMRLYLL